MNDNSPMRNGLADDPLLRALGENVRAARRAKGMARRVLSENSGVSARYLAQLEAGQGNISVALLQKVATALGVPLGVLLNAAPSGDDARMLDLYKRADVATQQAVLRRLEVAAEVPDRAQRICLIGLRGAGKSTLGQGAGNALGVPFVELNADIEAEGGMPIADIMALYGPDGYRQLEADAVRRMATRHDRLVLAVAGGIVGNPETYATLLARYHTIWIKAAPQDHMERVRAQGDLRPMAGNPAAMDQLRQLLERRAAEYARAEARIETSGRTEAQSLRDLLGEIETRGFLG